MLVSLPWSVSISWVALLRPPCPAVFSGLTSGKQVQSPLPTHLLVLIITLRPRLLTLTFSHRMYQRRQWQPTPVFLPGESQGRRSLVGCRLWGRTRVGHDWSDLATTRKCPMRKKMFVWISKTPYLYKSIYCLELHRQPYFDDAV